MSELNFEFNATGEKNAKLDDAIIEWFDLFITPIAIPTWSGQAAFRIRERFKVRQVKELKPCVSKQLAVLGYSGRIGLFKRQRAFVRIDRKAAKMAVV